MDYFQANWQERTSGVGKDFTDTGRYQDRMCPVLGCKSETGGKLRFFDIPARPLNHSTVSYTDETLQLISKRRRLWLSQMDSRRRYNGRICSQHFISGKDSVAFFLGHVNASSRNFTWVLYASSVYMLNSIIKQWV